MLGKMPMRDRVVARVRDILATHRPSPIKPETEKVIREVLEAAEDRVKKEEA
jgi:hypothetical protein